MVGARLIPFDENGDVDFTIEGFRKIALSIMAKRVEELGVILDEDDSDGVNPIVQVQLEHEYDGSPIPPDRAENENSKMKMRLVRSYVKAHYRTLCFL